MLMIRIYINFRLFALLPIVVGQGNLEDVQQWPQQRAGRWLALILIMLLRFS